MITVKRIFTFCVGVTKRRCGNIADCFATFQVISSKFIACNYTCTDS